MTSFLSLWRFWSISLSLGLLTGCWGSQKVERIYYSLQYPMGKWIQVYEHPRYPVTIRVQRFDAALAYARQEIVYRSNPLEFKYYAYRLWASKPSHMLREMITRHLRQAQLVNGVVFKIGDRLPDYELRGEVLAMEELNASGKAWFAHLAFRLELVRFKDGVPIWTKTFDNRKEVFEHKPIYVVKAISALLEKDMQVAVAEIDEVLERETHAPDVPRVQQQLKPSSDPTEKSGHSPSNIPMPRAILRKK